MLRSVVHRGRVPVWVMAAGGLAVAAACSAPGTPRATSSPSASPSSTATRAPAVTLAGPARSLPEFAGAVFPTRAAGWLLGTAEPGTRAARAEVWHTATAGAVWHVQWRGRGNPLAIGATGPRHAWALVTCPGPRDKSCQRKLLATVDSGRHWRVLTWLPPTVTQVQFASASFGVASVDTCQAQPTSSRCPGRVLVSHDGGHGWVRVLRSSYPVFAAASAAGQLWAAEAIPGVGGKTGPPGPEITFLTSTDGGHIWQRLGHRAAWAR